MFWTIICHGLTTTKTRYDEIMRTIFFLIVLLAANQSFSQEVRPTMLTQPPERDAIKDLLDRVSNCCFEQDFRGFMNCFTPSKASSIRKRAEHSFICGRVSMDVLDFFVISSSEESISFGLRYVFSEGESKALYCSKIVAKKVGDSWKIDSEQVKSVSADKKSPSYENANAQFEIGKEPGRPDWCPPGIEWIQGPDCANGRCGVR